MLPIYYIQWAPVDVRCGVNYKRTKTQALTLSQYDTKTKRWRMIKMIADDHDKTVFYRNVWFMAKVLDNNKIEIRTDRKYKTLLDNMGFKPDMTLLNMIDLIKDFYLNEKV